MCTPLISITISLLSNWILEKLENRRFIRLIRVTANSRDYDQNEYARKEPWVLYFGDYDPTGYKMVKKLKEILESYGIHFEHVAITKKQIRQFRLMHLKNTDPQVLAKLERDMTAEEFRRDNNGELFQIELDALNALRPKDFIDLLERSVDRHFDEDIYNEVIQIRGHSAEVISRLVREQIDNFDERKRVYEVTKELDNQ